MDGNSYRSLLCGFFLVAGLVSACGAPQESEWADGLHEVFRTDRVMQLRLSVRPDVWPRLLAAPEEYVQAELEADGIRYSPVGVRILGSPDNRKKSYRIRFNAFNPSLRFHGFKRINLKADDDDPSLVREALALALMARAGLPVPRVGLAWVELSSGGRGLYSVVQQVDRKLLRMAFGENNGLLFKGERGATLVDRGDDHNAYFPEPMIYEAKSDTPSDGWELVNFIRGLNRREPALLLRDLESLVDSDEVLRWVALNSLLGNGRGYPGTGDNYYLYRDRAGRFRFIPWGLNKAFGLYRKSSCPPEALRPDADVFAPTCGGQRSLVDRLLAIPALRERYRSIVEDLLAQVFEPVALRAELDRLKALLAPYAARDELIGTDLFSRDDFVQAFESNLGGDNPAAVPGLWSYFQARRAAVEHALTGAR